MNILVDVYNKLIQNTMFSRTEIKLFKEVLEVMISLGGNEGSLSSFDKRKSKMAVDWI